MRYKQKTFRGSVKSLKSRLQKRFHAALIVLCGAIFFQCGINSPLSTEGRIAFEQNLVESAYDFVEQKKREEAEAEKTALFCDHNKVK